LQHHLLHRHVLTLAPPPLHPPPPRQDNYLRIITYKTAYYTFYLPVASGLVLAGETRPEAFDLAQQICVEMGQYFQVGGFWGFLGGGEAGGQQRLAWPSRSVWRWG
jgi:hypothetical protein